MGPATLFSLKGSADHQTTGMASSTEKRKSKSASSAPSTISVTQFILASVLFQFFLSYIITETWTWGYKSKWMSPKNWKYLIVDPFVYHN